MTETTLDQILDRCLKLTDSESRQLLAYLIGLLPEEVFLETLDEVLTDSQKQELVLRYEYCDEDD